MSRISGYKLSDVVALRARIDREIEACTFLQDAGQKLADILFDELAESAVLFRVFGTVPLSALPEAEKELVGKLADERGCRDEIRSDTTVVSLLGTRGIRAGWNDRRRSQRHLAIPLTKSSFIQTIPMVARLMSDMGTGLDWVEKQQTRILVKSIGQMARLLYVDDARSATTGDGFKIVPDQDFVKANGVQTVIGLGGAYLNRAIVTVLLFTNEMIPRADVEKFMPVVNSFKTATMKRVMERRFFE